MSKDDPVAAALAGIQVSTGQLNPEVKVRDA